MPVQELELDLVNAILTFSSFGITFMRLKFVKFKTDQNAAGPNMPLQTVEFSNAIQESSGRIQILELMSYQMLL